MHTSATTDGSNNHGIFIQTANMLLKVFTKLKSNSFRCHKSIKFACILSQGTTDGYPEFLNTAN